MATNSRFPLAAVQTAFPRFRITREVRPGGQGAVFDTVRTSAPDGSATNEHVALKLYFDASQRERFLREVNALSGYDHPNLARLIEHGSVSCGNSPVDYVAWEFIDGDPLDTRIQAGPIASRLVARVGRDVCRALEHVWRKRIVHRDVKPNNIILRAGDNEVVLIDLGVARHLNERTLTGPGIVWGTRGYFSPEQARGEHQLTCNSDVFALGVVLQECLAGHHPTLGNQNALIAATPRTASISPMCPARLANVIDSMLHGRAAFRPAPSTLVQTFADLAAIL